MRTIIHDLEENSLCELSFKTTDNLISANKCNHSCVGCFSCWIKHPKKCVIKDNYSDIVDLISKSNELMIISKCRYGCYDNKVKRVFERCIGYVLPYFTVRNGEIHHKCRYKQRIKLTVCLYGNISADDRICVEKLVEANAINLNVSKYEIKYLSNIEELKKCIH